ncbi:MAG: two-component system sensor histidine kinase NtrB [Burkholderiaceae bacterium]
MLSSHLFDARAAQQRIAAPAVNSKSLIARLAALAVLLFVLLAGAVLWLSVRFEAADRQNQLDTELHQVAFGMRTALNDHLLTMQQIAGLTQQAGALGPTTTELAALLRDRPEAVIAQVRSADDQIVTTRYALGTSLNSVSNVVEVIPYESRVALANAQRSNTPAASSPYFVAVGEGVGFEVIDLWAPILAQGQFAGAVRLMVSLPKLLNERVATTFARDHEVSLTEPDGTLLARRISANRGRGVYTATQLIDLPGTTFVLRANSLRGAPSLIPNMVTSLVIVLAAALILTVALLVRDVSRRLASERRIAQQEAFRRAMEDSLVTGLRARDMQGVVTYVNPAFCEMVGYDMTELLGRAPPMPYWPPEAREEYTKRLSARLSGEVTRELFEAVFVRKNGTRIMVWVAESPLVDERGRQTGWMASVLDVTEKRAIEDLNRQQEEKLAATARLASMGEVASTLAHELNQPLAAISSYVTGSINMLESGVLRADEVHGALVQAQAQAQRAGAIIHSVHNFVQRRQPLREAVRASEVVQNIMPLLELVARKHTARIRIDVDQALPTVLGDRVMLEQVLLNLARNGIEAMSDIAAEQRLLVIAARQSGANLLMTVTDQGPGIDGAVRDKLFTPFYSTKPQGMGMGLSICRSVAESHGGRLTYRDGEPCGAVFELSLPI